MLKKIMNLIRCLFSFSLIVEALDFSVRAHGEQKRKDNKTPYIVHPIGVAVLVLRSGGSPASIIAALLHDVIEDTEVSADDVKGKFGDEVLQIVLGLTQDKSLSKPERKAWEISHGTKLSWDTAIVKMADCAYNKRSMTLDPPAWDRDRKERYLKHLDKVVGNLTALSDKEKGVFYNA